MKEEYNNVKRKLNISQIKESTLFFAFTQSVPVMLGYVFLGIAFGLMLQNAGYNFVWAFIISVFVYAGSMQFVLVTLLAGGAGLIYCGIMTLLINGRHIFYGLSFVEKFKIMGNYYPYMIFSLTDETYSVLCSVKIPEHKDEKKVLFYIAILDQCYWIAGSVIGAVAGQFITFNSAGIEFSMTALFVVIFINQWRESENHGAAIIGIFSSFFCLILFGADRFILPALTLSVGIMTILRKKIDGKEGVV